MGKALRFISWPCFQLVLRFWSSQMWASTNCHAFPTPARCFPSNPEPKQSLPFLTCFHGNFITMMRNVTPITTSMQTWSHDWISALSREFRHQIGVGVGGGKWHCIFCWSYDGRLMPTPHWGKSSHVTRSNCREASSEFPKPLSSRELGRKGAVKGFWAASACYDLGRAGWKASSSVLVVDKLRRRLSQSEEPNFKQCIIFWALNVWQYISRLISCDLWTLVNTQRANSHFSRQISIWFPSSSLSTVKRTPLRTVRSQYNLLPQ